MKTIIGFIIFLLFSDNCLGREPSYRERLLPITELGQLQDQVDKTLSGTSELCERGVAIVAVTEQENFEKNKRELKLQRFKLMQKFNQYHNQFDDEYLRSIAQAKYNFEFCKSESQVDPEICEQAKELLKEYKEKVNSYKKLLSEIKASHLQFKKLLNHQDSSLLIYKNDPFVQLRSPIEQIEGLETSLEEHFKAFSKYLNESVEGFKFRHAQKNESLVEKTFKNALLDLSKSPIDYFTQEDLKQISESRNAQMSSQGPDKDFDNKQEVTHFALSVDDDLGQDYQKDGDAIIVTPPRRVGQGAGNVGSVGHPHGRRRNNGQGRSNKEPGGRRVGSSNNKQKEWCAFASWNQMVAGDSYHVTASAPGKCNTIKNELPELFSEAIEEIGKELKDELKKMSNSSSEPNIDSIIPKIFDPSQAEFILQSMASRIDLYVDRHPHQNIDRDELKYSIVENLRKVLGAQIIFKKQVGHGKGEAPHVFLSKDEAFLKEAKLLQDRLGQIDPSQLREGKRDAYELAKAALQQADQSSYLNETSEASDLLKISKSFADMALSLTPGVSVVKDIYELITGKNMVTGESLSEADQILAGVSLMTLGVGGVIKKYKNIKKNLGLLGKIYQRRRRINTGARGIIKSLDEAQKILKTAKKYGIKNPNRIQSFAKMSKPNKRHYADKVTTKVRASEKNTIISKNVDVGEDIRMIQNGEAIRDGEKFVVNNRTYKMHENGTLYPMGGDGLYQMNRRQFKAYGIINEFGFDSSGMKKLNKEGFDWRGLDLDFVTARGVWNLENLK